MRNTWIHKQSGDKAVWCRHWIGLDCALQCFTSPPTQYRLYGRRFLGQKTQLTVSKYWRRCYKGKSKERKQL